MLGPSPDRPRAEEPPGEAPVGAPPRPSRSEAGEEDRFPTEALSDLRRSGALLAPVPRGLGGRGWGTEPPGALAILALLRRVGRTSLPLGRVYEGHVNALRLVMRYGDPAQQARAAADAAAGHLFGIWAAEPAGAPVRLVDGRLVGRKGPASAAGIVTRALLTAALPNGGEQLVLVPLAPGQGWTGELADLHGMRGVRTGTVVLDAIAVPAHASIGVPGDYMRQPEISLGAWRTLAVQLGGIDALVDALRADLRGRGRDQDPYQLARVGRALIARETARLWLEKVAPAAERDAPGDGEDAANAVKLARLAVEAAALDAIGLAQRSIGLAAFVRPHPVERLARDLSTYLRQPALDTVLAEAATHFMRRDPP